jgi:hypothetical protein
MLSRKERVKLVRDEIKKVWTDTCLSFMMEHEGELDWNYISFNPNITMDYIKDNPDKPWDWDGISSNSFTRDKQDFQLQQYRRHLASYRIQQHWHRIRCDPRHPVGRKKLELDYNREFGFS